MNISQEKEHLYLMMRDITSERRKLTDMYYGLKERLDELHKLESRGLEDMAVNGYIDMFNKVQKEIAVTNVRRESENIIKNIEKESEQMLSASCKDGEDTVFKKEIEEDKETFKSKKTNKKYINSDKIIGVVASTLKEKGIPMGMKDIYDSIMKNERVDMTMANFRNNIMPKVLEKNKNVQRAMRGFYQYKSV